MSTKSSLGHYRKEIRVVEIVHIYTDMLDMEQVYYLETNKGKVIIPKEIADIFGKALEELEDKE